MIIATANIYHTNWTLVMEKETLVGNDCNTFAPGFY